MSVSIKETYSLFLQGPFELGLRVRFQSVLKSAIAKEGGNLGVVL